VNIDTTTTSGIQRAVQLGFANSGLGDVIVTPLIYNTNDLLQPNAMLMGRFFALFHHPVERAVRVYNDLKISDAEVQSMTLAQYAGSPRAENNFLTRQLSNQPYGELTEEHVKVALEVIRRKFLVGLGTYLKASVYRFERFFRWAYRVNPANQEKCRDAIFYKYGAVAMPAEGSPEWEILSFQNQYDLQLYGYIESLFKEQEQFVNAISGDIRITDATCCECNPPTFPPEGYTCPLALQQ